MSEIKAVYGTEPMREGEIPDGFTVGYDDVSRIERRDENLGTYGIVWFDAYKGDVLFKSMNAVGVASVYYFDGEANG